MNLNRNKIFTLLLISILIFLCINIFNLSFLMLNTIYSAIFLLSVPGILLYLIIKPEISHVWENLLVMFGLSLFFVFFWGLGMNSLLPLIHINSPLTARPLTYSLMIFFPLLLIISYYRSSNVSFFIKYKKISYLSFFSLFIPILFPTLAALGAISLNNNGSNILSIINLATIVLYIFFISVYFNKINENVLPFAIYCIGLSILLMLSLRNWHIAGTDIIQEFRIFSMTNYKGFWSNAYYHTYNACLSLTIVPTFYNAFVHIGSEYIFKLYVQLIFAVTPVVVYLFTKRYISAPYSFLGTFIYMSFPIYIESMTMHIRQEFAFLFFALFLLAMFEKKNIGNYLITVMFGISMVVSHYSSAYIAVILLIFTYILRVTTRSMIYVISRTNLKHKKVHYNINNNLNLLIIIILSISIIFWYSIVNKSSSNITNYFRSFISSLNSHMTKREEMTPLNQFNLFYKSEKPEKIFDVYISTFKDNQENLSSYYPLSVTNNYKSLYVSPFISPVRVDVASYKIMNLLMELTKKFMKILFILGIFSIFIFKFYNDINNKDYYFLLLSSIFLITVFTILPSISLDYDILRTFQQLLTFSIYPIAFITTLKSRFLKSDYLKYIFMLFIVFYFLTYSHLIQLITGGYAYITQLQPETNNYDTSILHDSEVKSLEWMQKNLVNYFKIQMDDNSASKFTYTNIANFFVDSNLFPSGVKKNNYVYINAFNKKYGIYYKNLNGNYYSYTFPVDFLTSNKDLIYSNSETEVYK